MATFTELSEKVNEYESILEEMLRKEPIQIGFVKNGPTKDGDKNYYKVVIGGNEQLVTFTSMLMFDKIEKLIEGDEVLILSNVIIGKTPNQLKSEVKKPEIKLVQWDEIGGLEDQVALIRETIELPLANAKLAKEYGVTHSKGALLHGPAGCGKTLIAKAIASTILKSTSVDPEAFIYLKGGELLSQYVGATEQKIGKIFREAREYTLKTGKQSIIFIDEAEAILPRRGSLKSSDVETTIVPTFLAEMDGFDQHSPFVLLATNLPDNIDSAVIREGRIDIRVEIKRPTQREAKNIFKIHLGKVKLHDDVEKLSEKGAELIFESKTSRDRVSGAMIETMVKIGARKALNRRVKGDTTNLGLTVDDLNEAIDTINQKEKSNVTEPVL